ncbi:MAG: energy transducer TonB [Bdellovibrionales bacterium]|nr:energy transducer TonB [Bdellovibrionales bacterium]
MAAPDAFLGAETRRVVRESVGELQAEAVPAAGSPAQDSKARGEPPVALRTLGVPLPSVDPGSRNPASDRVWSTFAGQYGSVSRDYVEGLKAGEQTALNTKEFVFYGYFERIRARLDLAWQPLLREHLIKMYRSGRRLASDRDHTTRTRVVLDTRGKVVRVQLLEASGVLTLDDAAVEAFNQAGPFPNPPSGLISPQGTVEIQWEFVLKT